MTLLKLFKNNRVPVTWTTLLIGVEGPGKFERLLEIQEVINYAIQFVDVKDDYPKEVLELASAYKNEEELVKNRLFKLSLKENGDREKEMKKWITILLRKEMDNLPKSPLYGLIALTEFWEKFDYPNYSPHLIQGVGNEIEPEVYYSKEFYENCLLAHEKWISEMLKKSNI